ncbi:pro-glucagon-like [Phyllopteryx taeniolatus]|uniref:pro-glucagon-like n=1 Tax=Phyllopteryx taeniolatus TaxID=161469 RepID=UPI002AD20B5C|nr:pro-glucagon-like [Phyllopteryx taeniolatus]
MVHGPLSQLLAGFISSRQCCTSLQSAQGQWRMILLMWCMLVPFFISASKEIVLDKRSHLMRWHSYQMEKEQNIIRNYKRHSEGTYTSDLTGHLDKMKAKDFVAWLTSTKREGCHGKLLRIAADV